MGSKLAINILVLLSLGISTKARSVLFNTEISDGNDTISDLVFVADGPRRQFSIVNNSMNCATAWDPSSLLTSVFNGRNGTAVIYNLRNHIGVYFPEGSSNRTWYYRKQDWPSYFNNASLNQLYNEGVLNGTTFTPSNVTTEILDHVSRGIFNKLPNTTNNNSLSFLSNASQSLLDLFNGSLNGFLSLLADRVVPLTHDLWRMNGVFQGIAHFFDYLRGGIQNLLQTNFQLDPAPVFNARNGIDAFSSLLQVLENSYVMNDLLNNCVNCSDSFLHTIIQLGGDICTGVTRRLRAMSVLGDQFCNYTIFEDPNVVAQEWNQSVEKLYNTTKNLSSEFQELNDLVRRLRISNETTEA